MAVTVLGVQHRVGEYEGIHYDNFNLHCVEEVSGDTWTRGSRVTYVEKVPADVFYQANAVDQRNTRPMPAVTRVASTPTTVETLI